MKTDLFQSCGHCWVFQICWHTECSTFSASSFRIWNSSTGIPSPPLALFMVMLPEAHLTSHSRMSGSRVITPSWLSGSWRYFLYSSFEYSCHLFLISSASFRSIPFLSFIEPIFAVRNRFKRLDLIDKSAWWIMDGGSWNCTGDIGDAGSILGSGTSPGGRKWQATPVFLPGESHG